jgi:hypothetical protein
VFRYIEGSEFKRADFAQTTASTYRLERDIIAELLTKASLPQAEIDDAADFMLVLIERYSGSAPLFKPDLRRRKRSLSGRVGGCKSPSRPENALTKRPTH